MTLRKKLQRNVERYGNSLKLAQNNIEKKLVYNNGVPNRKVFSLR